MANATHKDASAVDPASPDFAARRAEARKALDAIDPAMRRDDRADRSAADPLRREWFEAVYALAGDDPARVPWANLAPHPLTQAWALGQMRGLSGVRALDVGCGLGDNAECLASLGASVIAFDFVSGAVDWARRRFPGSKVAYCVGDLFTPPAQWRGGFDLVHECYTLQALPAALLPKALAALASFLAPGGKLVLVARARDEEAAIEGPPWPLPPSVFDEAERQGLRRLVVEDIAATAEVGRRHWRAVLAKADALSQI